MQHPFDALTDADRRRGIRWMAGFTLITWLTVFLTGLPLATDPAPNGIVSLELAGSMERAESIIESWDRATATWNLVLDMAFLVAYSTLMSLLVLRSTLRAGRSRWFRLGVVLVWGQWFAGCSDLVENIALLALLAGSRWQALPPLAAGTAFVKFGLITAGIAFVVGTEIRLRLSTA
jgi:hypothetical protein